ncbi:MAG: ornithine carbamoyltransferase, partial [Myxococcales bacterium]|nr:ornithine carbamoyltransferase [Myxococcales bacterium]
MKDLLRTSDLSPGDLTLLLDLAARFKREPYQHRTELQNESVSLYFNKPSTRTRISFETAIVRLGGVPIMMGPSDLQLGRGETIEDTARVISRYSRAFVIRTFKDEDVRRFAAAASVPVINALTDDHHPCQSVADLLTLREKTGGLAGRSIAFVGDASNNVARSLLEACALTGVRIVVCGPPSLLPAPEVLAAVRALAAQRGAEVTATEDPAEAVRGVDAVYTDVWLSMGDPEEERAARFKLMAPYQVNAALMRRARPDAIFMHCLPDHRGEEVTAEVVDGPQSVV